MEDTGPDDLATLNFKLYTLWTNSSSSKGDGEVVGIYSLNVPNITEVMTTSLDKTKII